MYATYDDFSKIDSVENLVRSAEYVSALGYMDDLTREVASAANWIKDFLQNRIRLVEEFDQALYSREGDTVKINGMERKVKNDEEAWDLFYRSLEMDDERVSERVVAFLHTLDVDEATIPDDYES